MMYSLNVFDVSTDDALNANDSMTDLMHVVALL